MCGSSGMANTNLSRQKRQWLQKPKIKFKTKGKARKRDSSYMANPVPSTKSVIKII